MGHDSELEGLRRRFESLEQLQHERQRRSASSGSRTSPIRPRANASAPRASFAGLLPVMGDERRSLAAPSGSLSSSAAATAAWIRLLRSANSDP